MKLALVRNNQVYQADTLFDLVRATGQFTFDFDNGHLYIGDQRDTISYTTEHWTSNEMATDMARRAIKILEGWGWTLYKRA